MAEACPCCSDILSERQLARHLEQYFCQLEYDLEQAGDEPASEPEPEEPDPPPNNIGPVPNEVELNLGAIDFGDMMDKEDDEGEARALDNAVGMDLVDNGSSQPDPAPEPAPAPGLCRNPPVMIEEWPDPDAQSVASEAESDLGPINNEDRDPEYVEQDVPLRFDPDNEPLVDNKELWEHLYMELGNDADDEWIDMRKS
ncbi:hypothetical protein FRC10_000335 [Ceratobasidium sp. 414]|nr:hypothetical protein FRC10_000335 [Ceratobasidium sp. 414]